ncbi:MAG TPA: Do family serine endopeptidase [Terrimicrobiaceae bacterium]
MINPSASYLSRGRLTSAAAILIFAGASTGLLAEQESGPTLTLKRDAQPVARDQPESSSFAGVVKRVSPSVVKITTEIRNLKETARNEFPGRRRAPEFHHAPRNGLGSGVVISNDGYIATNNHVVDGADSVTVTLSDGRELTAKVVGRDEQTDIAVIKVNAEGLPAATFADTSKVEVGDRVLAIGNPFGIGETVTSGIISAKGRNVGILADVEGYEDFLQTDAAINPGNSGGALVDVGGRLVGINTAILSRSGGFQGVGLAVPANMVAQVASSLVKDGEVVRGYLGVNIQNVTPALAELFAARENNGALVSQVVPDSPAAKAGLKESDVITAVNGQPVTDANDLKLQVSALPPGTKLDLDILRDGDKEQLTAISGELPASRRDRRLTEASSQDDEGALNGVVVADLDSEARQQLRVPARITGAVITNVASDSAAARAGIRPGDVILEINKQPVTSAEDAVELSAKLESKKSLVKVWSRGSTFFVVVDESDSKKAAS